MLLSAPVAGIAAGMSSASEETYKFTPFYDQLGRNQKASYDAMVGMTPEKLSAKVVLPDPVFTEVKESEEKALEYLNIEVFSMIYVANEAIYMEKPLALCTWGVTEVDGSTGIKYETGTPVRSGDFIGVREFTIVVVMNPAYADDPATVGKNELREKVDALNKAINDYSVGSSDRRTMVGNINNYLTGRVTYDPNANDDTKISPYSHDAYGALVAENKYAVCDGFSKGFQALCQKYDIPCYTISGYTAPVEEDGHAWNNVQMDNGKWYPVDVTWNKTTKNEYFLCSADSFNKEHIPGKHPYGGGVSFYYPMLEKNKYDTDPWYTSQIMMYLFAGLIGGAVVLAIGLTAYQNKKGRPGGK